MKYNTAEEFANLIKYDSFEYSEEPDDLSVRITALNQHYFKERKILKELNAKPPYSEINTKYIDVIDILKNEFYLTLSEEIRMNFENFFYFTTVDNRYINASIKRSPDKRFFAVFINSSLITLLHRYGKLEYAVRRPEDVKFCSRFPNRLPTHSELIEMLAEMHCYYTETKLAHGPFILLGGVSSICHCLRLNIQEKLLLYHEIAHFLNGDLFDNVVSQKPLSTFENNLSYQREYLADLLGFGLYIRELKYNDILNTNTRHSALYALISMYQIQHGLQGIETARYPHPLNRMGKVIDFFYGQCISDLVEKAFKENRMDIIAPHLLPEINSEEVLILHDIENKLSKIFEKAQIDIDQMPIL